MLERGHVRLRALSREDVPILWAYWSDLDMSTLAVNDPPKPVSLEESQRFFEEQATRDDILRFVVEADGEVVGNCRLHSIDRHNRFCEVGIALGKPHWGKGYGQLALHLLVDFAFKHLNMHRVGLEALADDERAVGCYRKVGFVEEGRLRQRDWVNGTYRDVMMMGILDEEWLARSKDR